MKGGTFVNDSRVQLYGHGSSDDLAQKATGISGIARSFRCWAFAVGGHEESGGVRWLLSEGLVTQLYSTEMSRCYITG